MNYGMIRYILGRILIVEAILLCLPVAVGLIYREPWFNIQAILLTVFILLAVGIPLSWKRPRKTAFFAREGYSIVALTWFLMSFFGALPFVFSGTIPSLVDAFFETASGFTTTGASILTNVEALPHSIMFWRSFTHLIGGMGVLIFALAILPQVGADSVHLMKAESPGPSFGKIMSKVSQTARVLYIIYFSMTAVLIILLVLGGMPLFDSLLHAFGAAGTGGFGIKNTSVGFYDNSYVEVVLGVAMILFGVNFNVYYLLLMRQFKTAFKNEELRWYFGIIAVAIGLICLNVSSFYDNFAVMLKDVFFTVSSIITTTGFTTRDFDRWPLTSHVILLFLMFCGAMAGSTGGGIKVSRIAIYLKTSLQEVRHMISPNRILPIKFEGKVIDRDLLRGISFFFMTYMFFFSFCVLIVSIDAPNFVTALSAVAATLNNIGPGLDMVGPAGNYAQLSNLSKFTLSIAMIAGRLEIFPVLVLLTPRTWRRM